MLCCIGELACFVFGIIALIKGEFKLSANRVVRSGPARVIGVLLLLPLVIGTGGEIAFGSAKAFELIQQGKAVNAQAVNEGAMPTYLLIHLIGGGLPLLVALFVALATAGPARRPARFDDDDRPRRRRRRGDDDDEDEDRPRRRSAEEDEDEEDDLPRRRPRRDEDDEHIREK